MAAHLNGIEIGQRVSYKQRGKIRHGVVVAFRMTGFAGVYSYVIRNDATALTYRVLRQHILED